MLLLSEGIYLSLLKFDATNGLRPVLTFLGILGALFALYGAAYLVTCKAGGSERRMLLIIATGAVLFRLTLLPAGLPPEDSAKTKLASLRADVRGEAVTYERFQLYDSDLWRYLWDGHVAAHGINPYLYAPTDAMLDGVAEEAGEPGEFSDGREVWSDIRDNVNHAATPTIYPPLAQAVFRLSHVIAPGSVGALKSLIVAFDLLAALLIALTLQALGRPVALVILYAWNPLVIKVFAGSGHIDSLLVATIAATTYFLARRAHRLAAVGFALAVLSKLSPIVLFPFVARRVGWRNTLLGSAVLLAGFLPFLGAGTAMFDGFGAFARDWQFNAGPFALVSSLAGTLSANPDWIARGICGLAILTVIGWMAYKDKGEADSFARYGVITLGVLVLLSPTVMPWYVAWLLPLAVIAGERVWIYFSALVCLAFFVMVDGTERAWTLWLEYGAFALLLGREASRRMKFRTGLRKFNRGLNLRARVRVPLFTRGTEVN